MTERGRPPAKRESDYRTALRRAFLTRYDRDQDVAAALLGLIPVAEAAGIGKPSREPLGAAAVWGVEAVGRPSAK